MAHIRQSRPNSGLGFFLKMFQVLLCLLGSGGCCPLLDFMHSSPCPLSSARPLFDPTQTVFEDVLQRLIPTQIRQLILYIRNSKGYFDGFVRELTSAKHLYKHFLRAKLVPCCTTAIPHGGLQGFREESTVNQPHSYEGIFTRAFSAQF